VGSPGRGQGSEFRIYLPVTGPEPRPAATRDPAAPAETTAPASPVTRAAPAGPAASPDPAATAEDNAPAGTLVSSAEPAEPAASPDPAATAEVNAPAGTPVTSAEPAEPAEPAGPAASPDLAATATATAPAVQTQGTTAEAPAEPQRLRILLVEDNADTAAMLAALLELNGHVITRVSRGPTALERAREQPYEAVLLDIGLPGMDGFEVARRLRQMDLSPQPLLVAVTGYARDTVHPRRATTRAAGDASTANDGNGDGDGSAAGARGAAAARGTDPDVEREGERDGEVADPLAHFDHYLVKPVQPGRLLEILSQAAG
jgi:CheY-like chemotaxis protein